MKEPSIEEKAKRYDEALTKARNIVNSINVGLIGKDSFEAVFPELKESEDEKMELLEHLKSCLSTSSTIIWKKKYQRWIAWLEKQGEQKPVEWSKEDKNTLDSLVDYLLDTIKKMPAEEYAGGLGKAVVLLKSLKPQLQWKPSDEQMNALHDAAVYVDKSMFPYPKGILMKLYKQLKKLKD